MTGMRRCSALLSPCRIMTTRHPTVVGSTKDTFNRSCISLVDRPPVSCTREELRKVAQESVVRIQQVTELERCAFGENDRLKKEGSHILDIARGLEKEVENEWVKPFRKEESLLLLELTEECAKEQLNQCVEECKLQAVLGFLCRSRVYHINDFSLTYSFSLRNEWDDDLNAKKAAMLQEMLVRELPIRLPGVTCTIGNPHFQSDHYRHTIYVDVTCDWGDTTDNTEALRERH